MHLKFFLLRDFQVTLWASPFWVKKSKEMGTSEGVWQDMLVQLLESWCEVYDFCR
jgi:hypothetical protein